jgi:predicted DNA-binding transcriptional regulator AlpA|tara:strand:+ start:934 stop:1293 length:360 start_codon:yes stop_codon:yes gene_type:complete
MNKTEHHKKAILEALEQSLGVVTSACKKIGIGRTTFYGWLKEDPEFKKQVDDISNIALDFAESQLHQQIKKGNTSATIFYLKTKGKKRGYVERTEHTGFEGTKLFDVEIVRNVEADDSE